MNKSRLLSISLLGLCICGFAAFGQPPAPPVSWDTGYPDPKDAPPFPFGANGSITIFGSYKLNDPALGDPLTKNYYRVAVAGGTPDVKPVVTMNGKWGTLNATGTAAAPYKVSTPKGSWNVRTSIKYQRPNPNYNPNVQGSPEFLYTDSETATVKCDIK